MIYPEDNKCVICKKRYYGCKHRKNKNMLSCSGFVPKKRPNTKAPSLALARCLFGVCPSYVLSRLQRD